jgi:flagellar hook-length control protein FliK
MAHTLPVSADGVGLKSTWLPEGRMQLITPVVPSADTGTDSLMSFAQGQGLDDAALRRLFGDEFKPEASVTLKSGVVSAAAWIAGGQRQAGMQNPVVDLDATEPVAMLDRLAMERAALGFMPTKRSDLTLSKAPSAEAADQALGMTDDGRLELDLDLSSLIGELAPDADLKTLKAEERVALALRIGEMLAQRMVAQAQRGQWQLRFALNPQNLGRVEIDMQMRGGELEATLGALNPATRELLQDALPRLREMLQQSGMDVASLNIGSGGAFKNGGQPTPPKGEADLRDGSPGGDHAKADAATPQGRVQGADGWDIWV